MRWLGTVRGCAAPASFVAAAAVLASCNLYDRPGDPIDRVRDLDLLPRFPQSSDAGSPGKNGGR